MYTKNSVDNVTIIVLGVLYQTTKFSIILSKSFIFWKTSYFIRQETSMILQVTYLYPCFQNFIKIFLKAIYN